MMLVRRWMSVKGVQFAIATLIVSSKLSSVVSYFTAPPPTSPATGLPNLIYEWRGQKIRYQVSGNDDDDDDDPSTKTISDHRKGKQRVVLVHGLFVNADHWRQTLRAFDDDDDVVLYALDLLGSGYSSKPDRNTDVAKALDVQRQRFQEEDSVRKGVTLGTASGNDRVADVELRHPLDSCYNFYTWAEQICDFTKDVVLSSADDDDDAEAKATLVCNSIGTISSLQSVIDQPHLFNGVLVVTPNFRELHAAEMAVPAFTMPVLRFVQRSLRENGRPLFDALAKPDTVKQILREPYRKRDNLDDELVDVLLAPLLTEGAASVVFDTLSYSAGPLPEQQLDELGNSQDDDNDVPVWVCYGDADPWTPAKRVEGLLRRRPVRKVVRFEGVGHCPHDEAPELVNPLLKEFLDTLK